MKISTTGVSPSSTGHSRPRERNFAKKLFIGLMILVFTAFVILFLVGLKRDLRPAGLEPTPSNTNSVTVPLAPENQKIVPNN